MSRTAPLVIVVVALTAIRGVAQQDAPVPFLVGVSVAGEAILPFADFDGRSWRSSWPPATEFTPDPVPLQQLPAAWWGRSTFQPVWESVDRNGRRRLIQITGTDVAGLGSSCSSNVALKADVPSDASKYDLMLAANRGGVIEAVPPLTSTDPEWRTVSALLPGIFQSHEAKGWTNVSAQDRPDMSGRLAAPVVEAAFTSRDSPGEYLYFEARRDFTPGPGQFGDKQSFIAGWLWRRSSTSPFQAIDIRAAATDSDRKNTHSFHPLGSIRYRSQRFWLGTLGSYAYAALTVFDIRRAGIRQLVLVEYPGC